jgi:hypothetical protein
MDAVRVHLDLAEAVLGHHSGKGRNVTSQAGGKTLLVALVVHPFARSI